MFNKKPVNYENTVIDKRKVKRSKPLYVYDIETNIGMFSAGIG